MKLLKIYSIIQTTKNYYEKTVIPYFVFYKVRFDFDNFKMFSGILNFYSILFYFNKVHHYHFTITAKSNTKFP